MNRIGIALTLLVIPFGQALAQSAAASDLEAGKAIWIYAPNFANDCKLCHGVQGQGGFATALAGHKLTSAQFLKTVREGVGTMPGFVADKNLTDQQVGQVAAYLASLPKPPQPATTWFTRVPPFASAAQKLAISSGCGQCHGAIMANPRRTAGGLGADFEWFKRETWEHTTSPGHVNSRHLRMGNYTKQQVPEEKLRELWQFFAVEQGLRVPVNAQVSAGVPGANGVTYTVTVQNTGTPGKGLTAEYVTITLPLLKGADPEEVTSVVTGTTGEGYTGIHRDPLTNSNAAEFEIPALAPGDKKTFTITLAGRGAEAGIPRGTAKWEKPRLNSGGLDVISVSVPLGQ